MTDHLFHSALIHLAKVELWLKGEGKPASLDGLTISSWLKKDIFKGLQIYFLIKSFYSHCLSFLWCVSKKALSKKALSKKAPPKIKASSTHSYLIINHRLVKFIKKTWRKYILNPNKGGFRKDQNILLKIL